MRPRQNSDLHALLPPFYLLLSAIIFGIALHTPKQARRIWYLPLFLLTSVSSMTSSKYFWFSHSLRSLWTQSITLYVLHGISVLYIEQLRVSPQYQSSTSLSPFTPTQTAAFWIPKIRSTYTVWGNPQLLGVQDAVQEPSSRTGCSTRKIILFVFLRAIKLPIYYYAQTHLLPLFFKEIIIDIKPLDVSDSQQKFLRRISSVTSREIVIRSYTAIFWIWESVAYLDGANAILSIFFVLLRIDDPTDWPSLFGYPTQATSLRRFWNRFWHRLVIRPFTNYGRLVGQSFRMDPNSVYYKAFVSLVVFTLSGTTHAIVIQQAGLKDWHLEIYWFLWNFLGCLTETLVSSCVRLMAEWLGCSKDLRDIEESWLGHFVGYSWVFAFFFWSVPKWRYPRMEQQAIAYEYLRDFIAKSEAYRKP